MMTAKPIAPAYHPVADLTARVASFLRMRRAAAVKTVAATSRVAPRTEAETIYLADIGMAMD
jgi:hypothetical protein